MAALLGRGFSKSVPGNYIGVSLRRFNHKNFLKTFSVLKQRQEVFD